MHSPNLENLFRVVEVFFFVELFALHLALLVVFTMWLSRHVIHELSALRSAWRVFKRRAPPGSIPL